MQMPQLHKPTFMTMLIVVIVFFLVYHFMFRKGR